MIKILGAKRVLMLLVLLAMNAAVGAALYLYLLPEGFRQTGVLQGLRGQIATVQSDVDRMQVDFEQITQQQTLYEDLKKSGFFGNQDRRQAEKIFESIQKEVGTSVAAVVNIQAGVIEENAEAQKAEHKVLASQVSIKVDATDDMDVFRYLYLVEKFFPGHLEIEKISVERKTEVNGAVLRSIASGDNPPLVHADVEMRWRTMIPEKEVIQSEKN